MQVIVRKVMFKGTKYLGTIFWLQLNCHLAVDWSSRRTPFRFTYWIIQSVGRVCQVMRSPNITTSINSHHLRTHPWDSQWLPLAPKLMDALLFIPSLIDCPIETDMGPYTHRIPFRLPQSSLSGSRPQVITVFPLCSHISIMSLLH